MKTNGARELLMHDVRLEHDHFEKMFSDLRETFRRVVMQDLSLTEQPDILETALQDLQFLVDEMLEHFEEEEELLFVTVLHQMPDQSSKVDELIMAHDDMCVKLCRIEGLVHNEAEEVERRAMRIYDLLSGLSKDVQKHATEEDQLVYTLLQRLNAGDCERLLQELRQA